MFEIVFAVLAIIAIPIALWNANNGFVVRWRRLALLAAAVLGMALLAAPAAAHDHPAQDASIHEKFYKDWMMPDNPSVSCCHERDCYPTEARKTPNGWIAKRREDGKWLMIPEAKIERNRDNPDGRNHLCAPLPDHGDKPFCFIVGGGT